MFSDYATANILEVDFFWPRIRKISYINRKMNLNMYLLAAQPEKLYKTKVS